MDDLQGVLEASPDAVLVVDTEGVITRANRNVSAVLGYTPDEIDGMVVDELLLDEDPNHATFWQDYLAAPEPVPMGPELDLYGLRKDGRDVPVEISLGPVERDDRPLIVATIVDISKRKTRQRELERQNERLDEFTSVVSHDLRNPLTVASGRLELAREECDSDHLDHVERAHVRMQALIDDLLALAREGETAVAIEPVELAPAVEDCWQNVETEGASLDTRTEQTVLADAGRLSQLLENLIRNAVEHAGVPVTVSVGDLAGGFYVEDDGPGVPPDERDRIFETGYSTSESGTGFGLAIAQRIVETHGWRIAVTDAEGGGARFEITGVDSADP